eukprot:6177032-Prymnesium_polylepis.1
MVPGLGAIAPHGRHRRSAVLIAACAACCCADSNVGFEVATVVLETLAAEPWYTFVERRFWKPLGMTSTVAGLPALTPAL